MLVRLVQSWKASSPMPVTLLPIVMLVRLVKPAKAPTPMLVTLSGIVMLVRLVQSAKAPLPMLVTVLPSMIAAIISSPDASSAQPVIATASPSDRGDIGSL